jgi:Ca2+/Na+ antiporter
MEYGISPLLEDEYASYSYALLTSFFVIGVVFLCFSPVSQSSSSTNISVDNDSGCNKSKSKLISFISVPIALYGFIVAATWIDTIADQLVSLLSFFGILSHIPAEIMGLTVLAIGNSIGDLTANATMARKGLVNMAITACFAGPVFSILIGVGLAMYVWSDELADVHLTQPLQLAILFSVLNCALLLLCGFYRGHLYKSYSYGALILYAVYGCVSLYSIC